MEILALAQRTSVEAVESVEFLLHLSVHFGGIMCSLSLPTLSCKRLTICILFWLNLGQAKRISLLGIPRSYLSPVTVSASCSTGWSAVSFDFSIHCCSRLATLKQLPCFEQLPFASGSEHSETGLDHLHQHPGRPLLTEGERSRTRRNVYISIHFWC